MCPLEEVKRVFEEEGISIDYSSSKNFLIRKARNYCKRNSIAISDDMILYAAILAIGFGFVVSSLSIRTCIFKRIKRKLTGVSMYNIEEECIRWLQENSSYGNSGLVSKSNGVISRKINKAV